MIPISLEMSDEPNFLILGNVNIIDVNYTDWILMVI